MGDLDNDGDSDAIVVNNSAQARILINRVEQDAHWLGLRLIGRHASDAMGAEVRLVRSRQPTLVRRVHTDGSFASASDPRVLFGLGGSTSYDRIEVRWPDGRTETWSGLPVDRYHVLKIGTGSEPTAE